MLPSLVRGSTVSLELFTPRSAEGVEELLSPDGRLAQYASLGPSFISVSGGTSASLSILEHVRKMHCIRPQLHIARIALAPKGGAPKGQLTELHEVVVVTQRMPLALSRTRMVTVVPVPVGKVLTGGTTLAVRNRRKFGLSR